jgi:hypothetical protein
MPSKAVGMSKQSSCRTSRGGDAATEVKWRVVAVAGRVHVYGHCLHSACMAGLNDI